MSNEDSFFTDIFLDWFAGENCDSGVEPIAQYCPIGPPSPSDDNHVNSTSSMSSRSKKRNRELVSDDLLEAERKGTRHRRTGESSTSRQQPKTREDNLKELIVVKTVRKAAKILMDRIDRRVNKVKIADAELVYKMMAMRASHLLPQVFVSFDRFEAQSFRSNLKKFKENIMKIQKDYKGDRLTEAEAKQKLLEVGREIEQLDQHLEDFEQVKDICGICP